MCCPPNLRELVFPNLWYGELNMSKSLPGGMNGLGPSYGWPSPFLRASMQWMSFMPSVHRSNDRPLKIQLPPISRSVPYRSPHTSL